MEYEVGLGKIFYALYASKTPDLRVLYKDVRPQKLRCLSNVSSRSGSVSLDRHRARSIWANGGWSESAVSASLGCIRRTTWQATRWESRHEASVDCVVSTASKPPAHVAVVWRPLQPPD